MSHSRRARRPLKGAVIGYGFISSKGHVPAYLHRSQRKGDVEIIAVADICSPRRAQIRRDLPGVRVYPTYESLLKHCGFELDFIDICTPPSLHAEIAHAGLDRGLHVLCEKPLTCTLSEASALLEHAARARRVIFPCHNYKHAPVVKAIRQILQSGKIGRVRNVTLNTFRNTHARGVAEWRPHWRREKKYSGGGIAMDHGSHTFYLAFEWMGAYPTAVSAKMATLGPEPYDTEDNFTAVLTFPEGLAQAHLTWTAGVRKVIYAIQGERGAITVDDDDLQLALGRGINGYTTGQMWKMTRRTIASDWMDASHCHWFNSLFDEFRKAVEEEAFVGKEAREAYFCIQLIANAYRS